MDGLSPCNLFLEDIPLKTYILPAFLAGAMLLSAPVAAHADDMAADAAATMGAQMGAKMAPAMEAAPAATPAKAAEVAPTSAAAIAQLALADQVASR